MPVAMSDCGQLGVLVDDDDAKGAAEKGGKQAEGEGEGEGAEEVAVEAAPVQDVIRQRLVGHGRGEGEGEDGEAAQRGASAGAASANGPGGDAKPGAGEDEEPEVSEGQLAAMSARERKLFELRLKMNKGRKENHQEVEKEHERLFDPKFERKRRRSEWLERKAAWEKEVEAAGLGDKAYLNETAERVGQMQERQREKAKRRAMEGQQIYSEVGAAAAAGAPCCMPHTVSPLAQDAALRSYEKRLRKLPTAATRLSAEEANAVADPLQHGFTGKPPEVRRCRRLLPVAPPPPPAHTRPRASPCAQSALERVAEEVKERDRAAKQWSRHRTFMEDEDIDYINEQNRHFNRKLKRNFDKYTVEIRQNLERGSAL